MTCNNYLLHVQSPAQGSKDVSLVAETSWYKSNQPYFQPPPPRSGKLINHSLSTGIFNMKHCYFCHGRSQSYEECHRNQILGETYDTYACVQYHVIFDNGSVKMDSFAKSSIPKLFCEQFSKGNISEICYHPFYECKGKCCYEDYCNKGNILDTTGQDSSCKKVVYISDVVLAMGLLLGLSLAAFSVN